MAKLLPQTALKGRSQSGNDKLASGLGWFSIALGAAALAGFLAGLLLGLIPWLSARRKLHHARKSLR